MTFLDFHNHTMKRAVPDFGQPLADDLDHLLNPVDAQCDALAREARVRRGGFTLWAVSTSRLGERRGPDPKLATIPLK